MLLYNNLCYKFKEGTIYTMENITAVLTVFIIKMIAEIYIQHENDNYRTYLP